MDQGHTFIDTPELMDQFIADHQSVDWIGFDTEFIGERRFHTQLCIIQIASPKGIFIIDFLKYDNIEFLLDMIQNPDVLKITHAGENDYRILFNKYNIVPKNVIDIQIAAAFVGYNYPTSFAKLVLGEMNMRLNKGFTVTDWTQRPLSKKQLKYAIRDVLYLDELWTSLKSKLESLGRTQWAIDECQTLCEPSYYDVHPDKDFIGSNLRPNLTQDEAVFLLRFLRWRRSEAERLDYSKDMIFPSKGISMVTRAVGGGMQSLKQNRRITEKFVRRHGEKMVELYKQPPTEEELEMVGNQATRVEANPRQELLTKILDQMIHLRCLDEKMAHEKVIPRSIMKQMKLDPLHFDERLESGWRKEFLGEALLDWLKNRSQLNLTFEDGKFEFYREEVEA